MSGNREALPSQDGSSPAHSAGAARMGADRPGSVWIGLDLWAGCLRRAANAANGRERPPWTAERCGSVRIALDRWRGGEMMALAA